MREKKQHGGAREGAGRKPIGDAAMKAVLQVRLSAPTFDRVKERGGSAWARELIEHGLDCGIEALGAVDGDPFTPAAPVWRTSVPMAYSGVQAGFPSPAESYEESGIDFNVLLIENEKATFVVRAKGDSMIEAGISEGDLLVVDRSRRPKNGDIVIMRVNTEYTVKRLVKRPEGGMMLHPENSSGLYRDILPNPGDEWVCFGVVRHVIKSLA